VLKLAASTFAEVGTWRGDTVRRGLHDSGRGGDRDSSLPAAGLGLHHLAGQRVVDEPDLAIFPGHRGAAMSGSGRAKDQRRHNAIGSGAGLKPAASTIWVASLKPSATLSGW